MRDLFRDYIDGRLSRRTFFGRLVAAGYTAAAESMMEAADRDELPAKVYPRQMVSDLQAADGASRRTNS